jgi:hypothetical protein
MNARLPHLVGLLGHSAKLPLCPACMQMQLLTVKTSQPDWASIKTAHRSCQANVKQVGNTANLSLQPKLMA